MKLIKVEMLVSRGGPNVNDSPGDIVEVSKDEAVRMMKSDPPQCKPTKAKKVMTAVAMRAASEKAVK